MVKEGIFMERLYLDNAASTKVDPAVVKAMLPFLSEYYGNPSSSHNMGREAKKAVDDAKDQVAELLRSSRDEIIFTSGGTESNNLAILGSLEASKGKHLVTSKIEHPSVYNCFEHLAEKGYEVTFVGVNEDGIIDLDEYARALRDDTVLVSMMSANNEMGAVQPIEDMVKAAHEQNILFHTDAVQAVGQITLCKEVDMLSISSHKIYGPKGAGVLKVREGVLKSIMKGGAHQQGLRPGTENVPGIVGLGKACVLINEQMDEYIPRIRKLRDKLIQGILGTVPDVRLNGHPTHRLPNNINISFKGVNGSLLLRRLSEKGIFVSSGSACNSSDGPSRTLLAMGITPSLANCSLRLSLSKWTTEKEIDSILEILPDLVKNARMFGEAIHV